MDGDCLVSSFDNAMCKHRLMTGQAYPTANVHLLDTPRASYVITKVESRILSCSIIKLTWTPLHIQSQRQVEQKETKLPKLVCQFSSKILQFVGTTSLHHFLFLDPFDTAIDKHNETSCKVLTHAFEVVKGRHVADRNNVDTLSYLSVEREFRH
jgi:hypothetical protein